MTLKVAGFVKNASDFEYAVGTVPV